MTPLDEIVRRVRRFNRFYTRTIGALNETLSRSDFTLAEARVLFELGHRPGAAASELAADLSLDPAYLARILRRFREAGLVRARTDGADRRRRALLPTPAGQEALAVLQAKSRDEIAGLVAPLDDGRRAALMAAMETIEEAFAAPASPVPVELRAPRPGDIGWVIGSQSRLYAEEYGWSIAFEGLVAEICADFLRDGVAGRDFCWIADEAGVPLGAVLLVRHDDEEAKLRLLHVERHARGKGVGSMLVARCIEQARASGYRRLTLWTNSVLADARRIYERAGFVLDREEPHHSFGKDLVGQYWRLAL